MNGADIGLILTLPKGDLIQQSIHSGFWATTNKAEYEALIVGLSLTKEMGIQKVDIRSNSQLVVNQVLGTYQARDSKVMAYLAHVKELQSTFEEFNISQTRRLENSHIDALGNLRLVVPITSSQTIPLIYLQWPTVWKSLPAEVTIIDSSDS